MKKIRRIDGLRVDRVKIQMSKSDPRK